MTNAQIDDAIMASAEDRFLKVAMVVTRAVDKLGATLSDGPERYDLVVERLYVLVEKGLLVRAGDIRR